MEASPLISTIAKLQVVIFTVFVCNIVQANTPPVCKFTASDPDGDGWGWENNQSCTVSESSDDITPDSETVCVDTDGDGWGWDGTQSCRMNGQDSSTFVNNHATNGVCVDSDGDGWGWNGTASCRMDELPTWEHLYALPQHECYEVGGSGYYAVEFRSGAFLGMINDNLPELPVPVGEDLRPDDPKSSEVWGNAGYRYQGRVDSSQWSFSQNGNGLIFSYEWSNPYDEKEGKYQCFPSQDSDSPVAQTLNLIEELNVYGNNDPVFNRNVLRDVLIDLTVQESHELMSTIRDQGHLQSLVYALLDVGASAPYDDISQLWVTLLSRGDIDHQIELLTYTTFNISTNGGYYAAGNSVFMEDYLPSREAILIHEANHSFNHMHGLNGLSGLNEGTSITVAKDDKNLAETTFGTVLYYRDIGLQNYPRTIAIGDARDYDEKGVDFLLSVMEQDRSGINWFDPVEVQTVFDLYWAPINRNQPFDQWLIDAENATSAGLDWISRNRD